MKKDLISIIIPVYKTENYINRCVESVVNQTYKNIEIILIDDGSPDNCPAICDALAQKDDRIKVFHIENNGVSNARNFGLSHSQGEFIGFVDSDDYVEDDMFELLLNNLKMSDSDISICDFCYNDALKQQNNELIPITKEDALKKIAMGQYEYGFLWNKLYKRKVIDGVLMPDLRYCEDLVFNYFAMKNAECAVVSKTVKYHYNLNENSTTKSKFDITNLDAVKAREIILKDIESEELRVYGVKGYVSSAFTALSSILSTQSCLEQYDQLRKSILAYRKYIFKSSLFGAKFKLKTLLLSFSSSLYNKIIKIYKF